MPAMPIDNLNLAATPAANAAPASDAGGTGENGPSFQATLASEIRNQGSTARNDAPAAKKPKDQTAADPGQTADPAQADLLISGLIKPQPVPSAEIARAPNDSSGPVAAAATDPTVGPIDVANAAKAQASLADQLQGRNPAVADGEASADDATTPLVENAGRSKMALSLNRDAASSETAAKPRPNAFRQGLDHALQQVTANKSVDPLSAKPGLSGTAATQSSTASPAVRPSNEAMDFAKAIGQPHEDKRAAGAELATALPGKELTKTLDGLKHDSAPGLAGDIRSTLTGQSAASPAQSNLPPSSLRIDASIGTAAWSSALGQQVILMAAGQQQQAEIHLNPESLGPIKVTITLDNNQASLSFVAREVSVRDAIEASLPKLTSMMSESGISLGQTNVSADHSGNPTPWSVPETFGAGRTDGDAPSEAARTLAGTSPRILVQQGLIDTFA